MRLAILLRLAMAVGFSAKTGIRLRQPVEGAAAERARALAELHRTGMSYGKIAEPTGTQQVESAADSRKIQGQVKTTRDGHRPRITDL